jgi:hypothetical protein
LTKATVSAGVRQRSAEPPDAVPAPEPPRLSETRVTWPKLSGYAADALPGENVRSSMISALACHSDIICPTFSCKVIRPSKSFTRSAMSALASRYTGRSPANASEPGPAAKPAVTGALAIHLIASRRSIVLRLMWGYLP